MEQYYFHSVTLIHQSVRAALIVLNIVLQKLSVRNGKAVIIKERCIDCGLCIRFVPIMPKAVTDPLESIKNYKFKIALPYIIWAIWPGLYQRIFQH